jgi:ABC-type multidrug transport system ATPase subunit
MTEAENKYNISFFFDDNEVNDDKNTELDISLLMKELEKTELNSVSDLYIPQTINYYDNFTVKELLLICDYYGIAKGLKSKKINKEQIVYFLVDFESNHNNAEIVCKRQNLWFYMNELKNDKFMKKYVLW